MASSIDHRRSRRGGDAEMRRVGDNSRCPVDQSQPGTLPGTIHAVRPYVRVKPYLELRKAISGKVEPGFGVPTYMKP